MKTSLLRINNFLLYVVFCALAGTGLLLEYKTPLDEGENVKVFGISGEDWGEMHLWLGIAAVAFVVLHLMLNWRWMSKVIFGGRVWTSLAAIAVGVTMIIGLLFAPIQGSEKDRYGESKQYATEEHEEEDD